MVATLAAPAGIAAAATQTGEVLDVLRWFDRPPGLYRLDDVHQELLRTLIVYFGHELNRRRTASLLHVHPNTVDHRLRKIGTLTGVDVTRPAGIHRATAISRPGAPRAHTTCPADRDCDASLSRPTFVAETPNGVRAGARRP